MTFLEKLDILMEEQGINKNILSKESGIPYTTLDGFYKKGYDNAKLPTIKKLARYFNVTIDYLILDDAQRYNENYPDDEKKLIDLYHMLNDEGQEILIDTADTLVASGKYKKSDTNGLALKKEA